MTLLLPSLHRAFVREEYAPKSISRIPRSCTASVNSTLVSMGGGAYMCQLPHEVDYFELKLGPEICRDWLEPRADHGFLRSKD